MNRLRILIFGMTALIAVILITGILFFTHRRSSGNGISRYEWIRMMTDEFNMSDYLNNTPYYSDVDSTNEFFGAVQAAKEWNILEEGDLFDGEKPVTGEYAVLTAMRAIGAYKVKIYLKTPNLPSDDDYLKLALEKEVIDKNLLDEIISQDEAISILSKAKDLYVYDLWVDDYVEYSYKECVYEIPETDVISYIPMGHEISLSSDLISELNPGDIIVFPDISSGAKRAKRITDINDSSVSIEDAALEDIFNHLTMSDIISVSADDILAGMINVYGEDSIAEIPDAYAPGIVQAGFMQKGPVEHAGVGISVDFSEDSATITFVNHKSGQQFATGVHGSFLRNSTLFAIEEGGLAEGRGSASVSIDIEDIVVGVQTDFVPLSKFNYFTTQTEADVKTSIDISGGMECELPIASIPLVGVDGLASVNLDIKLIVLLDGSVEFVFEAGPREAFEYYKGASPRFDCDANPKEPIMNFKASLEDKLRIEPNIMILGKRIVDIELDIGTGAEATLTPRHKSNIRICANIDFYAPTLSIGWLNDNDGSVLGEILSPKEYDILTSENAPFRNSLHYELYKNKKGWIKVAECTYKETESTAAVIDTSVPHEYYADFTSEFTENEDHFEAKGKLYIRAYALEDDIAGLSPGESFEYSGTTFTLTASGEYLNYDADGNPKEDPFKWYIFDDKYIVDTHGQNETSTNSDGTGMISYYDIQLLDLEKYRKNPECPVPLSPGIRVFILLDSSYDYVTMDYFTNDTSTIKNGEWVFVEFAQEEFFGAENAGKVLGFRPSHIDMDRVYIIQ